MFCDELAAALLLLRTIHMHNQPFVYAYKRKRSSMVSARSLCISCFSQLLQEAFRVRLSNLLVAE
jgi:hypothetical protein